MVQKRRATWWLYRRGAGLTLTVARSGVRAEGDDMISSRVGAGRTAAGPGSVQMMYCVRTRSSISRRPSRRLKQRGDDARWGNAAKNHSRDGWLQMSSPSGR